MQVRINKVGFMRNQRDGIYPILVPLAVVIGIGLLTWVNYNFADQFKGGFDFFVKWLGAKKWLLDGVSPYHEMIRLEARSMMSGPQTMLTSDRFVQPLYPFYALFFYSPIGLFDVTVAKALFMTILEVSIALMVMVSLNLTGWRVSFWGKIALILFSLSWFHGFRTIVFGQMGGISALLAILGIYFIHQKQDVAAGVFLALSTINFQSVFLFILFVLIWTFSVKRFQVFVSTLSAVGALFLVSFVLLDGWFFEMLQQAMALSSEPFFGSPISIISEAMPGISDVVNQVLTIVLILYLIIEWFMAWGKDEYWFLWTASLTLTISILIVNRVDNSNFLILLPGLFLVFRVWVQRWGLTGRYLVIMIGFLLSIGLWGLFALVLDGAVEQTSMYLPLPIIVLFGLWWVRWWAIRPPKLLLQDFASRFGGGL